MTTSMSDRRPTEGSDLEERVVHIRRVAKVVKGGRNLRFNAMVVVGDRKGMVGAALGKGQAVPDAVRNGANMARKDMVQFPLNGSTVHHIVHSKFGASKVVIKPATAGAGIIAGGAVRAVMEAAGVRDVVAKALGSRNPINIVRATIQGLQQLQGEHTPLSDEILAAERAAAQLRERPPREEAARGRQRQDGRSARAVAPTVQTPAPEEAVAPADSAADPAAVADEPVVDEPTSGEPATEEPVTEASADEASEYDDESEDE